MIERSCSISPDSPRKVYAGCSVDERIEAIGHAAFGLAEVQIVVERGPAIGCERDREIDVGRSVYERIKAGGPAASICAVDEMINNERPRVTAEACTRSEWLTP